MNSAEEIILFILFFFILLPVSLYLSIVYHRTSRKRWLPRYVEEWKKTEAEMGFIETDHTIIGKYRNHNVTIDESEIGEGASNYMTRYSIDFENTQMILLYIRRSFPTSASSSLETYRKIRNIRLNDPQFKGLVIKGNKENEIKSILDSSIRNRLMSIKDALYEMEIGYGKPTGVSKVEIMPNVARYRDSRSLHETKWHPERFRLIVDTLIDIVEKIEKYTPSV